MTHVWRRAADGRIELLFGGDWPITDSATLAALRATTPWIVMPDSRGSLLWVDIPSRDREQARRALPFALEECLLDDPSQFHASLGPRPRKSSKGWKWPVLLVERAWRDSLLEQLGNEGIRPAGLVHPLDLEPQPHSPGEWSVTPAEPDQDDATLRLVQGPHAGFVLPADGRPAGDRMAEMLIRLPETERPIQLTCHGLNAEDAHRLSGLLAGSGTDNGIAVVSHPMPERPAHWFTAIEKGLPISATETAGELHNRGRRRAWVGVAGLAVMLAMSLTGLRFVEGWQAARQANVLETKIETDFRAALPDTRMVNPRVQVEQAIEQLGQSTEATSTFVLLVTLMGQALENSHARIKQLNYQDGRLQADWQGEDYERLQAATDRLRNNARITIMDMNASVEQGQAHMHIELGVSDTRDTR